MVSAFNSTFVDFGSFIDVPITIYGFLNTLGLLSKFQMVAILETII